MSKVNIVRRCSNCGSLLQSEFPEKEGYIENKSLLEAPLDRVLFCDKCYMEAGFSLNSDSLKAGSDFTLMMKDAAASDALIVYIINAFSFESSFIPEINEIIKGNQILVLANKRDLFPKECNDKALKEYVAHRFRVAGLPITESDVLLTSLATFGNNDILIKEINKRRRRHDVYIISPRGAGKSMFFSSFLYYFSNPSSRPIETSPYPGTITPVLQIPLDNSSTLYDTPALPSDNNIMNKLEKSVADSLLFSSPVKYKKIVMEPNMGLAIGAVAFIELLSVPKNAFKMDEIHLFAPPNVVLKKIGLSKGIENVLPRFIDKKGLFPKSSIVRVIKDLDVFDIQIEEKGDRSIGIEGLGWFSFLGRKQVYRVYVPKGVSVYTSRSKILTYDNSSKK